MQLLIWSIALLASPGLLLPMRFAARYNGLELSNPSALPGALLMDRLLFITLTMTALGLVALVIWEGVYLTGVTRESCRSCPCPAES